MVNKLSKLNDLINKMADAPFKYGKNDCYTFTSALVKEWHGKDFSQLHKGYASKRTADEYIHAYNGIESLTTGTLGYPVAAIHCSNGDVAIAAVSPGQIALGFVYDEHGLFLTDKTVVKVKLANCLKGWRIR